MNKPDRHLTFLVLNDTGRVRRWRPSVRWLKGLAAALAVIALLILLLLFDYLQVRFTLRRLELERSRPPAAAVTPAEDAAGAAPEIGADR